MRQLPGMELDQLTQILNTFNDLFGGIDWKDENNVRRQIRELPAMVARDEKYQNALKNSDKQNARMESNNTLKNAVFGIMQDNVEDTPRVFANELPRRLIGDKACDSDKLDARLEEDWGIEIIAPNRKSAPKHKMAAPCGVIAAVGKSSGCSPSCKTSAALSQHMSFMRKTFWRWHNWAAL